MKKYKLIQTYPGSPKLGTIISQIKGSQFYEDVEDSAIMKICFDYKLFSKYPKFWEEVVEKDYEIMSILIQRSDNHEERKVTNLDSQDYIECLSKTQGNSIHSVKRLSDGEIFTVGDYLSNGYCNTKILNFNILGNELKILTNSGTTVLNNLSHIKKPLFTTEDGVDIFEGDKYYIASKYMNISEAIQPRKCKPKELFVKQNDLLYFSTKEAAEEYILMNKPCLSIKDILRFAGSTQSENIKTISISTLKQTVKSKL